jgi:hypothetical protein
MYHLILSFLGLPELSIWHMLKVKFKTMVIEHFVPTILNWEDVKKMFACQSLL